MQYSKPPMSIIANHLIKNSKLILLLALSLPSYAQFSSPKSVSNSLGELYALTYASDLDSDGDQDILTTSSVSGKLVWFTNNGSGSFSNQIEIPFSADLNIGSMATLDVDKDGDQDIVATCLQTKSISLWKNKGAGLFEDPITICASLEDMNSLTVVDFDKDNDLDIAVALKYAECVWLENDLNNEKWNMKNIGFGNADYMDIVDFHSDGILDVVAISDNLPHGILFNGASITSLYIKDSKFIKAIDIDRDGDMDIVCALNDYKGGIILLEQVDIGFNHHIIDQSADLLIKSITMFDYDGDGDEDIFVGCSSGCGVNLYENIGGGNFSYAAISNSGSIMDQELISADINGDGKKDLIHNDASAHQLMWLENKTKPFEGVASDFAFQDNSCKGYGVLFKQAARGKDLTNWTWDFGDESVVSHEKNPVHLFQAPGTYAVTLTVGNSAGQESIISKDITIRDLPHNIDKDLVFCTTQMKVMLDSSFTNEWFVSDVGGNPFHTGNSYIFDSNATFYISKQDSFGCRSIGRDKITITSIGHPDMPEVDGATGYNSSDKLILKAHSNVTSEIIEWSTAPDGSVVHTGNEFVASPSTMITIYASAVSAAGCRGPSVPVTGRIANASARTPQYLWADGTQSESRTEGINIARDTAGNIVAYGSWYQGKFIAGDFELDEPPGAKRFIVRYNKDGEVLDAKTILTFEEYFYYNIGFDKLHIDSKNNLYITGYVYNNFKIGETEINVSQTAAIVAKLNPEGALIWYKLFYNSESFIGVLDKDDRIYVSGFFRGQINIDGIDLNSGPQDEGTFLVCFNSDGHVQYANATQGSLGFSSGLTVDKNGNAYIAGNFTKTLTVADTTFTSNDYGQAIIKYNKNGQKIWARQLITDTQLSVTSMLHTDSEGNVFILGYFNSLYDLNINAKILGLPIGGGVGHYLLKLTSSGHPIWIKRIVHTQQTDITDLKINKHGDIFLTGDYYQKTEFDGFALASNPDEFTLYAFAATYNNNGVFLWARDMSQRSFESCLPNEDGTLYVHGSFVDQVNLDGIQLSCPVNTEFVDYNVLTAKLGYKLKADFSASGTCNNENALFTDISTTDNHSITEWSWSFGDDKTSTVANPSHHYTSPGSYSVKLEITNSNGDHDVVQKNITIESVEEASIVVEDTTLVASDGIFFNWKKNDEDFGVHSQKLIPDEDGVYQVEVFNENGCSSISRAIIYNHAGIEQNATVIYPNPSNAKVTVASNFKAETMTLYNAFGNTVWNIDSFQSEIDISELPSGIYYLVLASSGKQICKKILKQ
jgi:PKD repeat protein